MMLLLLEVNFVIRINVVPLTARCLVHFSKEGLILEFLEFYAPQILCNDRFDGVKVSWYYYKHYD